MFYIVLKSKGKEIHRTEWTEHFYDLKNVRNRCYRYIKENRCDECEIYQTDIQYDNQNGNQVEVINENPYVKPKKQM